MTQKTLHLLSIIAVASLGGIMTTLALDAVVIKRQKVESSFEKIYDATGTIGFRVLCVDGVKYLNRSEMITPKYAPLTGAIETCNGSNQTH